MMVYKLLPSPLLCKPKSCERSGRARLRAATRLILPKLHITFLATFYEGVLRITLVGPSSIKTSRRMQLTTSNALRTCCLKALLHGARRYGTWVRRWNQRETKKRHLTITSRATSQVSTIPFDAD